MVKITRVPFNYDDESWVISSRSFAPPTKRPTEGSSEAKPKPPEPEKPSKPEE